jgi:hypothetical protein
MKGIGMTQLTRNQLDFIASDLCRYEAEKNLQISKEERIESELTQNLKYITDNDVFEAIADSNLSDELIRAIRATEILTVGIEFFNLIEAYLKQKIERELEHG